VIAQFEGIDHAFHNLLAYGAHAEVLAPQALRERIAAEAAETAALYASPKTGPSLARRARARSGTARAALG
jgi:hypothetical protein